MAKYRKQVSLGYDAEGRRVRKWVSADTQQELKRKERELLMNSEAEMQSNTRFGEYAQSWVRAYKSNKSLATQELYKYTLNKLKPLDNKRLKEITRTDFQRIINGLSDKPSMAQMVAITAKQIMESAAADNLIQMKYFKLELPKRVHKEKRAFTDAEKKAIRSAKLDPQERLFVDIEYYLGLRPEETRALQPRDFDLKKRTLTISRASALHGSAVIKETKTGKTRTIPVPDVLIAEIRAYNAHFSGFYYFADKQGVLFGDAEYLHFTKRIFSAINEALGGNSKLSLLNGMTMYTFRHNRATELYYLSGISTKKKAEYMGHSEIMFLKTYSHLDNEKEEEELLRKVSE